VQCQRDLLGSIPLVDRRHRLSGHSLWACCECKLDRLGETIGAGDRDLDGNLAAGLCGELISRDGRREAWCLGLDREPIEVTGSKLAASVTDFKGVATICGNAPGKRRVALRFCLNRGAIGLADDEQRVGFKARLL
jgi:hypothetical protein